MMINSATEWLEISLYALLLCIALSVIVVLALVMGLGYCLAALVLWNRQLFNETP